MARVPARVWAAFAVVAAAIRLYRLDHFSYWLDEIMQSFFIHGTWDQFWASLRFDAVHPPLDYLISRFAECFQPSDAVRKVPAVIWGSSSVVVLGVLVTRRAGRAAGLLSASFLALAPFHVRYSQEFRPYSLGILLFILSLLSLDISLERPGLSRVAVFYFSCLATAYALYLSAVVLAIAGGAVLLEDAWSENSARRSSARRFLAWSPVFLLLLYLGYLPWIPVIRDAASRTPFTAAPEMSVSRLSRVLAFFSFAPNDGSPLGAAGVFYLLLALIGLVLCLRRPKVRFIAGWVILGSVAVEILEHLHPHFFVPRHFLPAAVGIPVLVSVAVASIGRWNLLRAGATAVLIGAIMFFDLFGLSVYFREGRPDWRPLADFLRRQPPTERVLTENQYAQLCVAYYLVGPWWLHDPSRHPRSIMTLQGDPAPIAWLWEPGKNAWLVLINAGAQSDALKRWADPYPAVPFPTAEGGVILKQLTRTPRS